MTKDYNPETNHDVITLTLEPDGNWKGEIYKFGRLITVRDVGPSQALAALITHDGKLDN